MTRRHLSIDALRHLYFGGDPGLLEEDPGSDDVHCAACGAELPDPDGELFPACPACGHQVEASE